VNKEYPPKEYVVGRGKTAELVTQILQQYPDTDLKEVSKLVNPDQASGASHKKSKRGQSMTEEQVQERKELIAQVGSLEFKIIANNTNDSEAMKAAEDYFRTVKDKPALQSELDRLAFLGKSPPPPAMPNGDTAFLNDPWEIYLQLDRTGDALSPRPWPGQPTRQKIRCCSGSSRSSERHERPQSSG